MADILQFSLVHLVSICWVGADALARWKNMLLNSHDRSRSWEAYTILCSSLLCEYSQECPLQPTFMQYVFVSSNPIPRSVRVSESKRFGNTVGRPTDGVKTFAKWFHTVRTAFGGISSPNWKSGNGSLFNMKPSGQMSRPYRLEEISKEVDHTELPPYIDTAVDG